MKTVSETGAEGVVLLFVVPQHRSQREKIGGVYTAAIRRGWQIHPIEDIATAGRVRREIALWRPIGCLIDKSAMPEPACLGKSAFGGVPAILMGSDSRRRTQVFDRSVQDGMSAAVAAADELASVGQGQFAFIREPGNPSWSKEREAAFRLAAEGHGRSVATYCGPPPHTSAGRTGLTKWLRRLERPCGVMVAADHLAMHLYAAAAAADIAIPKDLTVVGVDNDEDICRNLNPSLSSVQLDYFLAGENAVMLLKRRLEEPGAPLATEIYRATGVVRRMSSMKMPRNGRSATALSFIAAHASEGISVSDVVSRMGCSRRLAERMFMKDCGRTILDAIHESRMEKAYSLLRSRSFPIDAIPAACGYRSGAFFKTFFKRETGLAMREWRKQAACNGL